MPKKWLSFILMPILTVLMALPITVPIVAQAANEYELWEQSPYITTGWTQGDINLQIAKNSGASVYNLTSRLPNRYLLVYKGSSSTDNHCTINAILFSTDGSNYSVLSSIKFPGIYKKEATIVARNISAEVTNTAWYTSNGYSIPYFVVEANVPLDAGDKDFRQLIVTNNNKLVMVTGSSTSPSYHNSFCTVVINGILYKRNGYTTKAAPVAINPSNGQVSYLAEENVSSGTEYYYKVITGNVSTGSMNIPKYTSTFPDGRTASAYTSGGANNNASLYLKVKKSNNTVLFDSAVGGIVTISSDSSQQPDFAVYAINNSKAIIYDNRYDSLNGGFRECYRSFSLTENDSGSITLPGLSVGVKGLSAPTTSHTDPTAPSLNFDQSSLLIGHTIRDGVIGESKLDYDLKQILNVATNAANNIFISDIVLLKKSGAVSGTFNTGQNLSTFSANYYGAGSTSIYFSTNGYYFQWLCSNPEYLTAGEYLTSFAVGSKTVYVKVKVVSPPSNTGTTNVVF